MRIILSIVMLAALSGCAASASHTQSNDGASADEVQVWVDKDGHLSSLGWDLTPQDLPAFAKQLGARTAVVRGYSGTDFSKAVQARDQLKAAGIANVIIGEEPND